MLQLSENKRRRPAQIAKKFKNALYASASFLEDGFLHPSHFFSSLSAAKHHAVLPLSHYQSRELEFSAPRCYRGFTTISLRYPPSLRRCGEEVNDDDLGQASSDRNHPGSHIFGRRDVLVCFQTRLADSIQFRPGNGRQRPNRRAARP